MENAREYAGHPTCVIHRFDHLCALVRDPGLPKDNARIVERLQPLLDMIGKIDSMRPPGDLRDEGTGNEDNQTSSDGLADEETRQSGEQLSMYLSKCLRRR